MLLLLNRCGNTLLFTGTSFECGMMGSSGVARTLISCLLGQYHSLFPSKNQHPPSWLLMHEHTQSMSHWHLLRLVGSSPAVRTYTCSPGLWHHWEHGAILLLSSEVNVSYQAVVLLAMVLVKQPTDPALVTLFPYHTVCVLGLSLCRKE